MAQQKRRFHSGKFGAAISVKIAPKKGDPKIVKIQPDGLVLIQLDCESTDQKSNPYLVNFLSEVFSVDLSQIDVVVGVDSEYKLVSILGVESQQVEEMLHAARDKQSK